MIAQNERIVGTVGEYLLIEKRSYLGFPYIVWEKPMPRVADRLTSIVVYLYPSPDNAKNGTKWGGTGFMVRKKTSARWYDYVITNHHVAKDAPFIRFNTHNPKNPIDVEKGDWEYSKTDDIAASWLERGARYNYDPIDTNFLLTETYAKDLRIGLGDDLFMVGRFLNHDGKERNMPTVRFGTIAMMPEEPIYDPEFGRDQESFLIEIRTIPGYSGSPVFAHLPAETRFKDRRFQPSSDDRKLMTDWGYLERCLGIEWCRIKGETVKTLMINGTTTNVQMTSGMSGCIPAWKIINLLEQSEKFIMQRKVGDARMLEDNHSAIEKTAAAPATQKTTPRKGSPIEIPVPTESEVESAFKKITRKRKPSS
jgi:hypothetical protein